MHVQVRAGTGGDEAALFAGDLLRMYERAAALNGWKFEVSFLSAVFVWDNIVHQLERSFVSHGNRAMHVQQLLKPLFNLYRPLGDPAVASTSKHR